MHIGQYIIVTPKGNPKNYKKARRFIAHLGLALGSQTGDPGSPLGVLSYAISPSSSSPFLLSTIGHQTEASTMRCDTGNSGAIAAAVSTREVQGADPAEQQGVCSDAPRPHDRDGQEAAAS